MGEDTAHRCLSPSCSPASHVPTRYPSSSLASSSPLGLQTRATGPTVPRFPSLSSPWLSVPAAIPWVWRTGSCGPSGRSPFALLVPASIWTSPTASRRTWTCSSLVDGSGRRASFCRAMMAPKQPALTGCRERRLTKTAPNSSRRCCNSTPPGPRPSSTALRAFLWKLGRPGAGTTSPCASLRYTPVPPPPVPSSWRQRRRRLRGSSPT
mmetsp:Transcript_4461/g.13343  ORF Transcript_4461/g.13343 Transcript_4461/m.13343 type:complete len:209 (+) Transcript_4461:1685-2311(+)